jgi:hypothetical protein
MTNKRKEHQMFDQKAHRIATAIRRGPRALVGLLLLVALALPLQATAADQISLDGSEAGTFQLLGPCESGGILLEVTGTGHSTFLGTYQSRYRECFDPTTGAVTNGSFTLTVANGDTVFGVYGGQAVPDGATNVRYDDPGVITGGTGRFAGAGGTLDTSGVANLATGQYTGTLSGSVSRLASD